MLDQLTFLPTRLAGHIQLTVLTMLIGTTVSVGLGLSISRSKSLRGPVLGIVGLIQTIPGLAMLAIMVPLIGIGFLPALVALSLYSMLPILRNTVVGISEVDEAVVEAARGVGMTPNQVLRRVQLPLAAPMIIGGIRTATVWTVGMATLATPIGATSLGNYIFAGLQTNNNAAIFVGCGSAALLAIVLDGIIYGIESAARRRSRRLFVAMLVSLLVVVAAGFAETVRRVAQSSTRREVRIGSKAFTEQYILSELLAIKIARDTGRPTNVRQGLGSTVAFNALAADELDVYVDYSGTIWATILKETKLIDPRTMIDIITERLDREYGIKVVGPLGFENAYGLAMRRDHAKRLSLSSISDLHRHDQDLVFAGDMEFLARAEYANLIERNNLEFKEVVAMDAALMYQALAGARVDIISAYTTEGKIEAFDLAILEDDVDAFPPYDAILLVAPGAANDMPELVASLEGLVNTLSADRMRRANWSVDESHRSIRDVAAELLRPADKP
ncbi:MAG: ABC transporter permease/substrate-binding protein [Planctomycetes bacterium]|nr:ABC transporter permease/substrate-binding protein [Planctomycetota bacterium]